MALTDRIAQLERMLATCAPLDAFGQELVDFACSGKLPEPAWSQMEFDTHCDNPNCNGDWCGTSVSSADGLGKFCSPECRDEYAAG